MSPQRPRGRVAVQPAVSAYLMVEEMKRLPVAPAGTKVPWHSQSSLAGLSEPQTGWVGLTNVYYQMTKRPLSFRSVGPLSAGTNPLQRGHSECSYSRSMMAEDRRSFFLPPYVTGIGRYPQPQMVMEFHKAEVGPTRKLCKNMKETQVPQEQLEDTKQPQESKVLVQAEKSFLESLIKNYNQRKKNQERPRKGCVQEYGEKRKHLAWGHMKQTTDLQSQDKKNQTDLQQPLQAVTRQRASPEKSPSEQEIEEIQPKSAPEKTQAWDASAKESESKTYPSINRENQQLWRKLQQLARDYYRVEETRRQLLKQKQELRFRRWDSVIRGTSITLAEREHKQRSPREPDMFKTPGSSSLYSTIRINLN